jgi:O-acetyl-ADP-ribose deacetylase
VISKASGPKLQTYCDDLVKQLGVRAVSTCTMTPPFNLLKKFRHIAHVVGPIYDKNRVKQCTIELKEAVITLLQTCETEQCRSVVMPAFSAGIFGFPEE